MAGIGHNKKPQASLESLAETDKKRVRDAVLEMNDSMTRSMAERDLQKEITDKMTEEIGIDKKLFKRMAKVYFKANYAEEVEAHKEFENFYDGIMK